ncbi:MAG TPA: DUF937 domain-containing protein, partial [Saprospiraceae bacterium]|nr:DUF937 domain-containing protein [Saprospiraceae bacterium]
MNEQDILEGKLDDNTLDELRKEIGADSNEQTEAAVSAVTSSLVTGLAKNAEKPNGLQSLISALDRDHDGSILDDAAGFIFGRRRPDNPRTSNGPGILEHIFGSRQDRVAEGIGRGTGMDKGKILQLMMTFAPLILGALSRRNRQGSGGGGLGSGGLGSGGLGGGLLDLLKNTTRNRSSQLNDNGLLSRLVDS